VAIEGRLLAGKYRIKRLLGTGGMGAVYAAEQEDLGRQVAVKVLHHDKGIGPAALARFKQEALAAAKLGHPNIVQVTDFQVWPDEPAILVMELLVGESLHGLLERERKLPPERAIFIVTQVLSALAVAHAAGIVHRDIKPANLFLTRTAAIPHLVKVLDFGIAKSHGPKAGVTTDPGSVLGTPAYMAPEQTRDGEGDHRIDIYATGVCLFEMLAGHRPHQAKTFGELLAVFASESFISLRTVAPEIDTTLADVVDRMLRRDPAERPQRALDVLELLAPVSSEAAVASASLQRGTSTDAFSIEAARVTPATATRPPAAIALATQLSPGVEPAASATAILRPAATLAATSHEALGKTASHALLAAVAGSVLCCAPVGLVGLGLGMKARTQAAMLRVPTPPRAQIAIALGLLPTLALVAFVAWGFVLRHQSQSAAEARIAALEARLGSTSSSTTLDAATACALTELHALQHGFSTYAGHQLSTVECQGTFAANDSTASLERVHLTPRSGASVDLNVCFERGARWTVTALRNERCQ
jgi:hypothetical protein